MENTIKIIKYLDLFGTRCTFYSEKMPKLYTVTGGIFTIISVLVCILIFVVISLDDMKRKFPDLTTSYIPSEGYRKIKFGQEKIWIPWRIVDYNNNESVNHTNLLYPIIYYYSRTKDDKTREFHLKTKILDYKLCSETSMVNESDIYQITIPLNELYCINMEDLEMGGSWISEYFYYISFDLFYCENGIQYDENNEKCSSFNKIVNFIGENNSLEIDVYYPIVQFQPTNKTYPVIVIYRQHFYHLSKYVYRIDNFFLQENVLTDDSGWLFNKEKNNSYWGLNSINDDTYFNGKERDLMNDWSSSKAYSFNIYLEPGIIQYKRKYKKLYIIFSDFFPFAYIIFIIMKNISKFFKKVESNKKMIELLFENLKEKQNNFEEKLQKLKMKNHFHEFRYSSKKFSSKNFNFMRKEKSKSSADFQQLSCFHKNNSYKNMNEHFLNNGKDISDNKSVSNRNIRFISHTKNKKSSFNVSKQNLISNENVSKDVHLQEKESHLENSSPIKSNKKIVKPKLFPYKYYLCSVLIRTLDAPKDSCLYTSRFAKVYSFLCQLFDITTYLCFQREFNALKQIFNEKSVHFIEKNKKININSNNFLKEINQCIREHKFNILVQGIKK